MDVAFFNIWQPTNATVHNHPLALLDWGTVVETDVMGVELGYAVTPSSDRSKQARAPQIVRRTLLLRLSTLSRQQTATYGPGVCCRRS